MARHIRSAVRVAIVVVGTCFTTSFAQRTPVSGDTRVNSSDGLTYVFIPPGKFTMGCSPGDSLCQEDEKPAHAEQIARGFWLGQTEVTQAAWKKLNGGDNPSFFKDDRLPVETVNWNQAGDYCKAIGGRLPSEAEWEYAARAGTTESRYGPIDDIAWYSGNSGEKTHPVGLKKANAFGLNDMLGNVWEWTSGQYNFGAIALRGGAWDDFHLPAYIPRASLRGRGAPASRGNNFGFRCVAEFN
jgi:formylglycine-generating enzyme required for sulfatase activity